MSIPRNWRLQAQRYRLIGGVCEKCHTKTFPPRDVCPECEASSNQTAFAFSGRGEIYSYSLAYDASYAMALIRLEEGPLLTAQLTDVDAGQLRVGLPVEMVTDSSQGAITEGYEFRPLFAQA